MGTALDRRAALEALLAQASSPGTVDNTTRGPGPGQVRQQAFGSPDGARAVAADTLWDQHNAAARQNAIDAVGPYGKALEAMRLQAEAARLAALARGGGGGRGGGGSKPKELYEPVEFDDDFNPYDYLDDWASRHGVGGSAPSPGGASSYSMSRGNAADRLMPRMPSTPTASRRRTTPLPNARLR